ncbi:MAG: Asp23/Gls24 family envelope stress response protein [Lachnospiraceae bacterium]|nr:Asp23/Gls24 family envelope stress response protein [Lachnospiraceae bacterium]
MKASNLNTHIGKISIENEVIAQYAGAVADGCFGIVGMAGVNMKEGIVKLLRKDAMTKGINVNLSSKGRLTIDFHVIVSYGVNIRAVCDNLINSVRYKVEEFTGLEVEKINIYVEGVRLID